MIAGLEFVRQHKVGEGTTDLWSMTTWARDRWPDKGVPEMSGPK